MSSSWGTRARQPWHKARTPSCCERPAGGGTRRATRCGLPAWPPLAWATCSSEPRHVLAGLNAAPAAQPAVMQELLPVLLQPAGRGPPDSASAGPTPCLGSHRSPPLSRSLARSFASFAFAAQSLLSALGVVQFISNIVFGRFVNKEKVGPGWAPGGRPALPFSHREVQRRCSFRVWPALHSGDSIPAPGAPLPPPMPAHAPAPARSPSVCCLPPPSSAAAACCWWRLATTSRPR